MHIKPFKQQEIWFITGSQHLYGPETLEKVATHSREIASFLNSNSKIPAHVIWKPVVTNSEDIFNVLQQASTNSNCVAVITWMHTFSPAKMWIRGLNVLNKPLLHLHTQFNRDIPWDSIDMNFMNLNQSAHGDREFGFMVSRMRLSRKVVVGHWQDEEAIDEISTWCRAAAAWDDWQGARFVRFGDNMRQVAVTEGDKVEAELRFGYSVNTHGIGDLVGEIAQVTEEEISRLVNEYEEIYTLAPGLEKGAGRHGELREAARIEAGLESFLENGSYKGFTDTFEDLHGILQLPGIAVQRLMFKGYGFAGEGDWKTAALVRAMKIMGKGLAGGNAFMEDYTYHFEPGNEMVLGSHMLEIDPSLSGEKPRVEIHHLGIGGKSDPVRLVFKGTAGMALNASLIDMGNRFRMIVNEVEAVDPKIDIPKLPVARVLWKPLPDMKTACSAWILAGGAHHTGYSQNLKSQHLLDFSEMAGIECIVIDATTKINAFKNELRWNEVFYQLNKS